MLIFTRASPSASCDFSRLSVANAVRLGDSLRIRIRENRRQRGGCKHLNHSPVHANAALLECFLQALHPLENRGEGRRSALHILENALCFGRILVTDQDNIV
jgi:hypothetical protein